MKFTVAALYHFTRIKDPVAKRYPLLSLCRSQGVRGTVLLATEGINGTIAGTPEGIASVIDHLEGWPEVDNLEVKYSFSNENSFKRLKVKIKNEIVTIRKPEINTPLDVGKYVQPAEWNDLITREDVLLVDTRNNFEFKIGRFSNAIEPGTDSFHEFPDWADKLASRPDKPSAVAMYCTGGIRCEKATAYMKQVGFDEVYHLKGGILKYLEDVPEDESLWEGECFVFDGRVSLKHGLKEGNYELCYGCQFPISPSDRSSPL
ncbi:MAG TPA: rhodanese-related sulfurtransferase, partial [Nitrospinaceae bacterium]|nr:rhodanese-related sulfurtransferase [Nitrospinaceae bacterium]